MNLHLSPRPLPQGYGSNLTFEGTVECDAAIMDGRTGDFGSVGAVSGASLFLCVTVLESDVDSTSLALPL